MAQDFHEINLQSTFFPMLSEQQSRTVIGGPEANRESPGIAYCHNVMPTKYGMNSIGFLFPIEAFVGLPVNATFSDIRTVYDIDKNRLYIAWDTLGNAYALIVGSSVWITIPPTVPVTSSPTFDVNTITIGTVNGISFIFFSGIGCFNYNNTTNTLDAVTLTGINIPNTLGVVGSSGYLIAYTDLAIAWSSTVDPTDFIPSLVTGSGGGNVAGTRGSITFIVSNSLGIIAYTISNAVAGTYTGNTQFPFKFREIDDSKGGITLDRVAYEANSASQFIYSKAGLQSVTSQKATTILPEVTDFLAGRRFEDYNQVTRQYEITDLGITETMVKKIKYVASRYLIISYGLPSTGFTHALVFDTALNKLGKLRGDHVDVFEFIADQAEISKETIAFLGANGAVALLDFSSELILDGVLILGKIQATRTRLITLLGVELENAPVAENLNVSTQAALDGKNFTVVDGIPRVENGDLKEFVFRSDAKNHSITLIGEFNLVTGLIRYAISSRR